MAFKVVLFTANDIRSFYDLGLTEEDLVNFCSDMAPSNSVTITSSGVYLDFTSATEAAEYMASKHNSPTYRFVPEHNGIELYFAQKPQDELRTQLVQSGWAWSKNKKCWYAMKSVHSLAFVRKLCNVDNGLNSSTEMHDYEVARMALDEGKRQEYIAMIKPSFSSWEWRDEYDDYSLYHLENIYSAHLKKPHYSPHQKRLKADLLANVPEKVLTHFNYSAQSAAKITLEEAKKLKLLGEEYQALAKRLTKHIELGVQQQFNAIYKEISIFEENFKTQYSGDGYSKNKCFQCGREYIGGSDICPDCFSILGLDDILKKIDSKRSSFWKNLSVSRDWHFVGVARNFTMGTNVSELDGSDRLSEIDLPTKKTFRGFDTSVLHKIQIHYHKVARRLLQKYSKEQILGDEQTFSVLVVCLKLSNNGPLANDYIAEYCLRQLQLDKTI